jgi:peptidoglycan/xylan/chitin deacetylase (PgdA/CDA1 family)
MPNRLAFYGHVASSDPDLIMRNRYRYPSLDELSEFIDVIRSIGYRFVNVPEFCETGDDKRALLTFDDGFLVIEREVWPCLAKRAVPFAIFVLGRPLTDEKFIIKELRPHAEQGYRYFLGIGEIEKLRAAGVFVGYHSDTHYRIGEESVGSALWLREIEVPPRHRNLFSHPLSFAYPFCAPERFELPDAALKQFGYKLIFDARGRSDHGDDHYYRIPLDVEADWSLRMNPALFNFKRFCLRQLVRNWPHANHENLDQQGKADV